MSHRHGDHMGGMSYLLSINPKVKIFAPKEGFGVYGGDLPGTFFRKDASLPSEERYYGGNPPPVMRFGSAWPGADITLIDKTTEVSPGIHLICPRVRQAGDAGTARTVVGHDHARGHGHRGRLFAPGDRQDRSRRRPRSSRESFSSPAAFTWSWHRTRRYSRYRRDTAGHLQGRLRGSRPLHRRANFHCLEEGVWRALPLRRIGQQVQHRRSTAGDGREQSGRRLGNGLPRPRHLSRPAGEARGSAASGRPSADGGRATGLDNFRSRRDRGALVLHVLRGSQASPAGYARLPETDLCPSEPFFSSMGAPGCCRRS